MNRFCLAILVTVFFSSVGVPELNHNAVLISGNKASAKPTSKDQPPTIGEPVFNTIYFWSDLFLMWELLYDSTKARYCLYGAAPDSDHIWVFYGPDAKDYKSESLSTRYDTWERHRVLNITDYGYYKSDIMNIFDWLAHGNPGMGIDSMTPQDNLFSLVLCHGRFFHSDTYSM